MKRLTYLLIAAFTALTLTSCGGDSSTGPDPGNEGNGEEETTTYTVEASAAEGGSVSPSGSNEYDDGETAELTAEPNDEYLFTHWSGDIDSTADNPLSLSVDRDYSLTANFEKKSYALTTNTDGEGVIAEEVVQPKTSDYEHGTTVELTANPAEGYQFVEWKGDLTGTDNPVQITVDGPQEVTAIFEKKSFALTINTTGNGSVAKSPDQSMYEFGTTVELEATPASGQKFVGWTGGISSSDNPVDVTLDEPKDITAFFEEKQFKLASNGVTITCDEASVGDSGTVNGTTYIKRKKSDITPGNAPTTCTSGITDMSFMFYDADSFNGDIGHWDVSSVTLMNGMFVEATSFNQDLGSWNVSNATNMRNMFQDASSFNQDISGWNVSSVTTMALMFSGAANFNQNLSSWDVSRVTEMNGMFNGASAFNADLNSWDVSSVDNMRNMFADASAFNGDISTWDVSSVTSMASMFSDADSFNGDISNWDVSAVENMQGIFQINESFNGDLSGWDVSSVKYMNRMFYGASAFNADLSSWDVSSVVWMSRMFEDASSFNSDLSNWDVSSVTRMRGMFRNATAFNQDLDNWQVSLVTNMESMFESATSFNGDIGNWDVGNVSSMDKMFYNASSFNQDLSTYWCVPQIPSEPTDFATGSMLSSTQKPMFGECK